MRADPRIDQARNERNLEKAKRREAESERDQLLEGIEAHRVLTQARAVNRDRCLYALADRIKSKDVSDGSAATRRLSREARGVPENRPGGSIADFDAQGGDAHAALDSEERPHATRGGSDQVDGVAPEKHFLVWRDKDGPRKIEVFLEQDEALDAYNEADSFNANHGGIANQEDVCLFGSDSLATLVRTHASWFAPEMLDTQALLADIAHEASAGQKGGEG